VLSVPEGRRQDIETGFASAASRSWTYKHRARGRFPRDWLRTAKRTISREETKGAVKVQLCQAHKRIGCKRK